MSNTIAVCFKSTTTNTSAYTDTGTASAPLFSGETKVPCWQSAQKLCPDTWRLQLPLDDCCKLVLPYHAVQQATDGTDSSDVPKMGAKSTTTSNHPRTCDSVIMDTEVWTL